MDKSMDKFNPNNMTHSGLVRFAQAVDMVMDADFLSHRERTKLISFWAYQYQRQDVLDQLAQAIKRCQADPATLLVNASGIIDAVTGEIVAYNSGE